MMGQGFVWIIVVEVSLCSKRLDSASMWLDVAGFHGVSLIHNVSWCGETQIRNCSTKSMT